jgi:hypothetical protein
MASHVEGTLLAIENDTVDPLAFILEPYGRRYVVRPGVRYDLVAEGSQGEPPKLLVTPDGIELWCSGMVEVLLAGTPAPIESA